MFRINAFGQRVYCNPRLVFVDPPEGGNGGQGGDGTDGDGTDKAKAGDKGFPENTPLEQMSVEQREAYWKHQARKHENTAKARADYDTLKAAADELAQLKAANATEQDKALENARREGENIGAQRYLKAAVEGRFQGITGKTSEEVATIFEHVDPLTFTDDKGDIDLGKLQKYAEAFGTKEPSNTNVDPVAEALKRQRQAGGGSGSSISDKRREVRESMTRKTA